MDTSNLKFKLIIGLGNPGKDYENTYHNAGFLFINYLMENQQVQSSKLKVKSSETYMNESGKFVAKELKKSGTKPEELLIVHDDSDIELGNYKLSFNRNAAGHHGVESIIKALKTKNFWRLRIGIRPPQKKGSPRLKAEKFVLKKITAADKKMLEKVFEKATAKL